MAADRTLANVRRERIHAALCKLEPLVTGSREKLAAIEAEITGLTRSWSCRRSTDRPNRHFERGELAMDILPKRARRCLQPSWGSARWPGIGWSSLGRGCAS